MSPPALPPPILCQSSFWALIGQEQGNSSLALEAKALNKWVPHLRSNFQHYLAKHGDTNGAIYHYLDRCQKESLPHKKVGATLLQLLEEPCNEMHRHSTNRWKFVYKKSYCYKDMAFFPEQQSLKTKAWRYECSHCISLINIYLAATIHMLTLQLLRCIPYFVYLILPKCICGITYSYRSWVDQSNSMHYLRQQHPFSMIEWK